MEVTINIDGEKYEAIIPKDKRPKRYEIKIKEGVSINDYDQFGDNLLYGWMFPADSFQSAINEFVRRVKLERLV